MTEAEITELLRCDAVAGKLYWRERKPSMFPAGGGHSPEHRCGWWNTRYAGKEAGTIGAYGYRMVNINGRLYGAHRIIWLMARGEWPEHEIDHINGVRTDNRLENIRSVARAENMKNQKMRADNSSGVTGVSWSKARSRWVAYIDVDGKRKPLGRFRDVEDAIAVRLAAQSETGFHQNHGRVA